MGGTTSKPEIEAPVFQADISKAKFDADYVQSLLDQATETAKKSAEEASTQLGQLGSEVSFLTAGVWSLGTLLVLSGLGFLIYYALFQFGVVTTFFGISKPGADGGGNVAATGPPPTGKQATAPVSSNWFSSLVAGNGSSGTLVSNMPDATNSSVVKATSAPLSSGGNGGYGMQWWMFIKDWNYGYGKDKQVLSRADPTNTQILNPSVALHPTDNTLRVSVSVFPDNTGGSSKTQPAPAGHSAATDDVFICEVPNLPLQDWFSVSMTVFGRNLDIYIDGKLVKSCLLPGVPKPASGDITLAGNGGFSGSLCGFTHYSRMLTPSDASTFYSAGTSCKSSTGPSTASTATGYAVKFGVYDTVGKKIQEYTF